MSDTAAIRQGVLNPESPVLIAPERDQRPHDFSNGHDVKNEKRCPFCPGHEDDLPEILHQINSPFKPSKWELIIAPNKFEAIGIKGKSRCFTDPGISSTILNAHGIHNVIIDTPEHDQEFSDFPKWRFVNLFNAIKNQFTDLYEDTGVRFLHFFKNFGPLSGASLEHSHCQIIGLPNIPPLIAKRLNNAFNWEVNHGFSIFNRIVEHATINERIVIQTDNLVCLVPYESRSRYEMWILPTSYRSKLYKSEDLFEELASMLAEAFRRLKAVCGELPSFNLMLDEMPARTYDKSSRFYRWRLIILPRRGIPGGLEMGTNLFITAQDPIDSAKELRKAEI